MQETPLSIRISGASGMVGTALSNRLSSASHKISRFVRGEAQGPDQFAWLPGVAPDPHTWEGVDVMVHLAGDNIASGRWNDAKKKRIRDSRVPATRALCESIAQAPERPKVLVCASAIGYYGDRGSEWLTEASGPGTGFLPTICKEWEEACEPARAVGVRVVNLRIGIVLAPQGGALNKMLKPFRFGVGGRIGNGRQYWSWIALPDVVGIIQHAIQRSDILGPVNVCSPVPVSNREFTNTLGRVMVRPTLIPLPAFAAKLVLGREMASDLLLASARVQPEVLIRTEYAFQYTDLEPCLIDCLS